MDKAGIENGWMDGWIDRRIETNYLDPPCPTLLYALKLLVKKCITNSYY